MSEAPNPTAVRPAESVRQTMLGRPNLSLAPLTATIASALICYGLFFRRGLGLSVIGYSLSPAERLLHGEIPYRDFLFNYTPGVLWINALVMRFFGTTMLATRTLLLVFKVATVAEVFRVSRRFVSDWVALVPVALTLAWLGHHQVFNVYPDSYLILFALWALTSMLNYDQGVKLRWLAMSGFWCGLVLLFKHNVGIYVFAAACLSVICRHVLLPASVADKGWSRVLSRDLLALTIGFVIVMSLLFVYLAYNHALGDMLSHFLHHATEYSETRAVGLPPPRLVSYFSISILLVLAGAALFLKLAPRYFAIYMVAVLILGSLTLLVPGRAYLLKESAKASVAYYPPFLFTGALFWGVRGYRQAGWSFLLTNRLIFITGLFAVAVYLEVFPRADYYHLVRVLPVVFVFMIAAGSAVLPGLKRFLEGRLSPGTGATRLSVAAPLVFLLITGLLDTWAPQFDGRLHFRARTELSIERGRGILAERNQAELAEGLVKMIQANSGSEDPIFSFSQRGSSLYFLSNRRNPSRLLWWSSVGIKDDDRESVIKMIRDGVPRLVVIQDVASNNSLIARISESYYRLGIVGDIAVFDRRR